MSSPNSTLVKTIAFVAVGLVTVSITGCGESKQDLFLKHAKRDRGDDPPAEQTAEQTVAQPVVAENKSPPTSNQNPSRPAATASPAGPAASPSDVAEVVQPDPEQTKSLAEQVGLKPISERRPEEPLSVAERRRRAYDNLLKINDGLLAYLDAHGHYPQSYTANEGGVPTLSWRVELLPYLGYKELYEKFDFTRAWNMAPNRDLLQFIPDEYVSPERFDTKTNYQFPVDLTFLFGGNKKLPMALIDDGPENTIMLLEVNDNIAVNWTEPKDFKPDPPVTPSPYLGGVREDGTFALWANGFPVLLEKSLTDQQLFKALTMAGNDGQFAKQIHRPIAVEEVDVDPENKNTLPEQTALADAAAASDADEQPGPIGMGFGALPAFQEQEIQREPVPSPFQITASQSKLREIFRDKIEEASSTEDKAALAREFLDTAQDLEADPAGAYVLQSAALKYSVEAGDSELLVRAIDQRVARFEVDSFKENLKWIQEFGQQNVSRDASTVSGDRLLRRAIPVVYAGIREDEYMLASSVVRIASRYTGMDRDQQIPRLLTRLRTQLAAANREYEKSVKDLELFRINPDDKAAGAAFGRFLCFVKGDWLSGLKLIADGPNGDLAEIARLDLRGATRSKDQVGIADAWWDLSRRGSGIYQQGAQDRALLWYNAALGSLPDSLDKIHVENRLKEAAETDGRSPMALCVQLAQQIGVDLTLSLTTLAVDSNRQANGVARIDE